ncbi:NB-ARC domain-containing protein [Nocardiopsis sp. N85]|uniref:NB-ARC domain-containing protein n=1 Tax=Nocardiopsis sp. N85 TaxID=3029400 RepID=UPI00237FD116|nr:NB-ARC domain-containing protein [Nocardiopsis sp. N85]MDE3721401.1 NB-ARC domain-containing protein [Nocardiopsis sp. N85]
MTTALIIFLATAVALPLLLNEFGEWAPWLAVRLVRWTARQLGSRTDADRYAEEWEGNLNEVPGKLAKLAIAIGIMAYAPRLRGSLRWSRARRLESRAPIRRSLTGAFVGREAELEAIVKHLRRRFRSRGRAGRVSVLAGMGGVGKTTLAAACATKLAASFPEGVLWLSPAERADLSPVLALLGLAKADIPQSQTEQMSLLWRHTAGRRVLVILDGAGEGREENQGLVRLRLMEARCSVLVTTRDTRFLQSDSRWWKVVPVRQMTRRESFELLRAQGLAGLGHSDLNLVSARLGDLPLALVLGAAWMRVSKMPVSEYIKRFDQAYEALESQPSTPDTARPAWDTTPVVGPTWEISLGSLKKHDPGALALLQLCSCTDGSPLQRRQLASDDALPLPPELKATVNDPVAYRRMLRSIAHHSLAEVDYADESIHLHRLLRLVVAGRMSETERSLFEEAVARMGIPGDSREWE